MIKFGAESAATVRLLYHEWRPREGCDCTCVVLNRWQCENDVLYICDWEDRRVNRIYGESEPWMDDTTLLGKGRELLTAQDDAEAVRQTIELYNRRNGQEGAR